MSTIGPDARATAAMIGHMPTPRIRLTRRNGTSASIGVTTRMMM